MVSNKDILISIFLFFPVSLFAAGSTTLAPAAVTHLRPYTHYASNLTDTTKNFTDFVGDSANECNANDDGSEKARSNCFVRYKVNKDSSGGYTLANANLHCPNGYTIAASFGNTVWDPKNPSDNIYYLGAQTFYPVTQATHDAISSGKFKCSIPENAPKFEEGSQCIDSGCKEPKPQQKIVNGYMMSKNVYTYEKDTYNQGPKKCEHYDLAGCPAWCSRWQWEDYSYSNVSCTITEGFYKINTPTPELMGAVKANYTPSTFICAKPYIVWRNPSSNTMSN